MNWRHWIRETLGRYDLEAYGALFTFALLILMALASIICFAAPLWMK